MWVKTLKTVTCHWAFNCKTDLQTTVYFILCTVRWTIYYSNWLAACFWKSCAVKVLISHLSSKHLWPVSPQVLSERQKMDSTVYNSQHIKIDRYSVVNLRKYFSSVVPFVLFSSFALCKDVSCLVCLVHDLSPFLCLYNILFMLIISWKIIIWSLQLL